MIDVAQALQTGELVKVTRPTKVGVARGWRIAEWVIHEFVPMWCRAAGITPPTMPPVTGFSDLPAILEALKSIPVLPAAISLRPDVRTEGLELAQQTLLGPLRAVETALQHAGYPPAQVRELCAITFELERVLPHLASLAVARHRAGGGDGFDLGPWQRAVEELAAELER